MEQLKTNETVHITAPTFSRILDKFLQENDIIKYRSSELQTILRGAISEAVTRGLHERDALRSYVTNFLRIRRIYSPSPFVLDRFIGNIAKSGQIR